MKSSPFSEDHRHNKAEQCNRVAACSILAPFGRGCRLPQWTGAIACPSSFNVWHEMKLALYILSTLVPCVLLGDSPFRLPDDPLLVSALSDRILLIEVTEINWKDPESRAGVERRDFTVTGKIIETIRGKSEGDKFIHSGTTFKLVDAQKFKHTFTRDLQYAWAALDSQFNEDGRQCITKESYVATTLNLQRRR